MFRDYAYINTYRSIKCIGIVESSRNPQSTVSQHSNKLKILKLVSYERKGLEVFFVVDDSTIIKVIKTLGL
ncbi:hypothetical protein P4418_22055 [Bacillus thuringiensis]|nr:hypothetical protein [Bacillus thuringiensis]MED3391452.1 hypothetical protein [Bacillus thuringiensis]